MKDGLSYLEIIALVRELKELVGAKVENVYQPGEKEIVLHLYLGQKPILKIEVPRFVCVTEYKKEYPQEPAHFCMFLRKYLTNARLIGVTQPSTERVIEFEFKKGEEHSFLICEFFSDGNIIICDKDKKILVPLISQTWKDRIVRPKAIYKLPPKGFVLDEIDFPMFKKIVINSERNQIVKCLAIALGIGGVYAEELCLISNVEKTKDPKEVPDEQLRILFDNFLSLIEKAREGEIQANIIFEDNKPIDVQPFLLDAYAANKKENFESFNKAVDKFFVGHVSKKVTVARDDRIEKEVLKHEMLLKQHKDYFIELEATSKIYKAHADYVYQHLNEIQEIINEMLSAHDQKKSWDDIKAALKNKKTEGNERAKLIKEIIPEEGVIVIDFESGLRLNFRASVTENANYLYERSKKMQAKLEGVQKAIDNAESKLKNLRNSKIELEKLELKTPKKIEKREKVWYEKFHWFYTSGGKLVIAGRDANQNEILINKHLEPKDIVFHADVHGSPFAILKEGSESNDEEKSETSTFTLCHSRAWQNKKIESVYWVKPEQVSKQAPAGEYIAKGGFMIYGKKNYVKDVELKLGVGVQLEPLKVISGQVDNLRKKARYYAVLLPGEKSKDVISKNIKEFLINVAREDHKSILEGINLEEIKEHVVEQSKIFGVVD